MRHAARRRSRSSSRFGCWSSASGSARCKGFDIIREGTISHVFPGPHIAPPTHGPCAMFSC